MSSAELLTPEEVAQRLKVKLRTVQEWLRTGRLAGLKLGKLWRIRESDLKAFLGAPATTTEERPSSVSAQESPEERRARVMALAGSLAHLPGSVDEFLQRKHEDIELEEERHRRRWGKRDS